MLRELKTSQIIEYKKILKTVLEGLDSAYKIRQGLIDYDSVSKMEYAKYDSLNDPEPYYHLKLFDSAIGIIRLYNSREWIKDDDEGKYFHFTIRCYNFTPRKDINIKIARTTRTTIDFGEYLDINDLMKDFYTLSKELFINKYKLNVDLFEVF